MQKNYHNYDFTYGFDFEKVYSDVVVTLCHPSLFSVYFHLLKCFSSCDKVENYYLYYSCVRDHSYGNRSYCHDVVVANQVKAYQDDYMFLQDNLADFDVFLERPICMNYPNFPLNDSKCDFYTELHHVQDLFVPCFLLIYWQDYILTTLVNIFVSINLHYMMKKLCMRQFTFLERS